MIVFGDAPFPGPSPLTDFVFTYRDPGLIAGGAGGGHNGRFVAFGLSFTLPGWEPLSIGEALNWSGTSSALLGSGDLLWSTLFVGDGAVVANFAVASLTSISVPEPSTLALFGAGLVGLGALGWRRRKSRQNKDASLQALAKVGLRRQITGSGAGRFLER